MLCGAAGKVRAESRRKWAQVGDFSWSFLTASESDLSSLSISFGRGREDHSVSLSNGERNVRTERCYASAGRERSKGSFCSLGPEGGLPPDGGLG